MADRSKEQKHMTENVLDSAAVSAFCRSTATMLTAGIQNEEALMMLCERKRDSRFWEICHEMYGYVSDGSGFAAAMRKTNGFPDYACDMAAAGEESGFLPEVLESLSSYYDEETRIFGNIRKAMSYPAMLLCAMAGVLLVVVACILPAFTSAYSGMGVALSPLSETAVSIAPIIGWVAFALALVGAIGAVSLSLLARSHNGQRRLIRIFASLPAIEPAMYQMALSRFTSMLSVNLSAGMSEEDALQATVGKTDMESLEEKIKSALNNMSNIDQPMSLAQAIDASDMMEPLHARMLSVGMHSGSAQSTLSALSQEFFEDGAARVDELLGRIEPTLAVAFALIIGLAVASVVMPMIGMLAAL